MDLLKNAKFNFRLYGFNKVCTRCSGSGEYSYNMRHGRTCYKCAGTKWELDSPGKRELIKLMDLYPEGIRYSEDLKNGKVKGKGNFLAKFKNKEVSWWDLESISRSFFICKKDTKKTFTNPNINVNINI